MLDPARGPRDSVSWLAIDIFVFANGQQYSPPRKYHLQADELEFWENTLSYLARAHYGPRYKTTELYTTTGRKVCSPMELSNGGTYVAVIPPDPFIDTGYEKYLLKASRSLERRQRLQSALLDVKKPDAGITETITEDKQENLIEVTKETKQNIKTKPESASNEKVRITGSKAYEGKGRTITNAKPNISRRYALTSVPRKSSIRTKNSVKKMSKTGGTKTKTSEVIADKNLNSKVKDKTEQIKTDGDEVEILTEDSYKTIILDKPSIELDPAPSSATMPSIYANPEIDTISLRVPVDPNESTGVKKEDKNDDIEEFRNIINHVIERAFLSISPKNSNLKRPSMVSENRMTLTIKGESVSLKLQMEVKNAEGVTTVIHENKEKVSDSTDTTPLQKPLQRGSQTISKVNISNRTLQDHSDRRKISLQAIISDICFGNQCGCPKVIILKCPYCGHQYTVNKTNSVPLKTKDGQKLIIVMPLNTTNGSGVAEKLKGGQHLETEEETEEERNKHSYSTSYLSIAPPQIPCSERVKTLGYDRFENEEIELLRIDSRKQQTPAPMRKEHKSTSSVKFSEEREVIIKKELSLEDKADASVLTDWCNTILEAKVEDDGRYSFYLPSLEKLRYYKL